MTITYEDVIPSLIPNTTMVKGIVDGVHRNYRITPIEGYVLHDNVADGFDLKTETVVPRFSTGMCSCGKNYDFSPTTKELVDVNGNTVTVTAYGDREFYAFDRNLMQSLIYGDAENVKY